MREVGCPFGRPTLAGNSPTRGRRNKRSFSPEAQGALSILASPSRSVESRFTESLHRCAIRTASSRESTIARVYEEGPVIPVYGEASQMSVEPDSPRRWGSRERRTRVSRTRTSESGAAERVGLDDRSPWLAEHRSRYHFARSYVTGRTVLDVACGTGFGGPIMLASGAEYVVGMDISTEAVRRAAAYRMPGYGVSLANALRLPLADGVIGTVTSFETIEHVTDGRALIEEFRRVIRSQHGTLVLSTPNAHVTQPVDGVPANPYHVKEYYPEELHLVLSQYFPTVQLFGQVVSPDYGPCPFWESHYDMPYDTSVRVREALWKLERRIVPRSLQDRYSKAVHGRLFYPGETDFVFESDQVDRAHATIAVCMTGS